MKFVVAWRIGFLALWYAFLALDTLLGWEQPAWLTVPGPPR